jgi:TRAP transporter TAXI family solute receptor
MKKTLILTVAIVFGLALMLGGAPADVQAKTTFVTIGTGGITGVYYPTGGAIAKMVNAKRDVYGIRATVESTGGSAFNINAVMAGDLEFGVAQSDRQFQAFNGTEGSEWAGKPQPDLRAVFSIHAETVDLIASADSGINSIQDLKGKRINIGNFGSGFRQNAIDALEANGLNYETDFMAENLAAPKRPASSRTAALMPRSTRWGIPAAITRKPPPARPRSSSSRFPMPTRLPPNIPTTPRPGP